MAQMYYIDLHIGGRTVFHVSWPFRFFCPWVGSSHSWPNFLLDCLVSLTDDMSSLYILDSSSYMNLTYRSIVPYPKPYHWLYRRPMKYAHLAGMVEIIESCKTIKTKYGRVIEDLGPKMKSNVLCEPKKGL